MIKTYESKHRTLHSVIVYVESKEVKITFSNGRKDPWRGGQFSTDDKKIQKALETRKDFDRKFFVVSGEKDEYSDIQPDLDEIPETEQTKKAETEVIVEDDADDDMAKQPEPEAFTPDEPEQAETEQTKKAETEAETQGKPENVPVEEDMPVEVVDGINKVQEARELLMDRFEDLTYRQVGSKAKILEVAKEKGIKFPDLN